MSFAAKSTVLFLACSVVVGCGRRSPIQIRQSQDIAEEVVPNARSLAQLLHAGSNSPRPGLARTPTGVHNIERAITAPFRLLVGIMKFCVSIFGCIVEKSPPYTVETSKRSGKGPRYEVRRYSAYEAIRTRNGVENDSDNFMALAGYIGVIGPAKNAAEQKISMTTPVISEFQTSRFVKNTKSRMMFTLPSAVTSAPRPLDKRVQVLRRPETLWAVYQYRGGWDRGKAKAAADALRERLVTDGYRVDSSVSWEWWRYNPPFTLPWLRTNEVAIKLVA